MKNFKRPFSISIMAMILFLIAGVSVASSNWHRIFLHDLSGNSYLNGQTNISVDYTVLQRNGVEQIAEEVWLNISNLKFTGNEKVRVVFISYYVGTNGQGSVLKTEDIFQLDLAFENGRFSGKLPHELTIKQHPTLKGRGFDGVQEIAVVVDGNWIQDPQSGRSNFRINMYRSYVGYGQDYLDLSVED